MTVVIVIAMVSGIYTERADVLLRLGLTHQVGAEDTGARSGEVESLVAWITAKRRQISDRINAACAVNMSAQTHCLPSDAGRRAGDERSATGKAEGRRKRFGKLGKRHNGWMDVETTISSTLAKVVEERVAMLWSRGKQVYDDQLLFS